MTGQPYIPEKITVHLGAPDDASAMNVTVDFADYIKNVGSSELYPTWPEEALRANIYAIVSFALNRVYTEWYRSRGYDFDITNDTNYDQYFVNGRDIFQPISELADELFNDYVRRQGTIEPLFTAYCDGVRTNCGGLKQWGTVELAEQGYLPYEMLTYYYGDDIEIVKNAPVAPNVPSYPGAPLEIGSAGDNVVRIQSRLNRISRNYPAIPRIEPAAGFYDTTTEDAVKAFQQIFNLPATGVVDKATWYKINRIYNAVKRLAELDSEGLTVSDISLNLPRALVPGDTGGSVRALQYFLSVIGAYYDAVPPITITGTYDEQTERAVRAFQQIYGLPVTGSTDGETWEDIYSAYKGIADSVPVNSQGEEVVLFPGTILREGMQNEYVKTLQQYLTQIHKDYPQIPEVSDTGYFGPVTRNAVTAFQRFFGLTPTGTVGAETWNRISDVYSQVRFGYTKPAGQYPGYIIR